VDSVTVPTPTSADPEDPNQRLVLNYAARGTAYPLDWQSATRGIGTIVLGLALSCTIIVLYLNWSERVIEGFKKAEGKPVLWDSPKLNSYIHHVDGPLVVLLGVMLAITILSTVVAWTRSRSGWIVAASIVLHLTAMVFLCVLSELQRMDIGLLP
jgi:hypothetical protein